MPAIHTSDAAMGAGHRLDPSSRAREFARAFLAMTATVVHLLPLPGLRRVKAARDQGGGPVPGGHIALVGAGPGARDLLTLRAVERLQAADVIFYDRLVDPEVLDLARPCTERVFVGKEVGACAWPQERICALIVAEAEKGRRVVRLKSGDPMIFGRATEEMDAARTAGIPCEVVPGVTAASAASAALGRSLTERGETDTLILATGTCRPGDATPDWAGHVRPGTTLAIYMGVRSAGRISAELQANGAAAGTPVALALNVSTPGERLIHTDLAHLAQVLGDNSVRGSALILIRFSKRGINAGAIAA